MKIILDENKKEGVLVNTAGKEISRYSYKNLIGDELSFEDFKKDIEGFNETLAKNEDFDNIKDMAQYVKIHNFA